jgi:4'-phosphopantetheinyl transferase EntD
VTAGELSRLYPAGVVVEVANAADEDELLLHGSERALMGAMVRTRRREFAAGRNVARRALARLGFPPGPLLRHDNDRDIEWPRGSTASISHTTGLCAVACGVVGPALRSLGLDVEQAGPLGADIVTAICRPDELVTLGSLAPPVPSDWPRLVFAMKEAAYKAWYPVTRRVLDFPEMRISVDAAARSYSAEVMEAPMPGLSIAGRFGWDGQFVYAGAVLTRG